MRRATRPITLIALACLLPLAHASWSAAGDVEPSTQHDAATSYMWAEPDTRPGAEARVYFNAVLLVADTTGGVSPNAQGTRLAPPTSVRIGAYLGLWKDCNADGYIGHAETALLEYREELATGDICPAGTPWRAPGWFTELVWIGPSGSTANFGAPRALWDDDARAWADFGQPGELPELLCQYVPLPRDAFASTGSALRYADCSSGHSVTRALAAASDATVPELGFDDPYHPERDCDSALNQPIPLFGDGACDDERAGVMEENSGRRAYTVWDCGEPETAGTDEPVRIFGVQFGTWFNLSVGDEDDRIVVPGVNPSVDPDGSAYDAVNETESGALTGCSRERYLTLTRFALPRGWDTATGDNATTNDPTDGKRRADFVLRFQPTGWRNYGTPLSWSPKLFGQDNVHRALGEGWMSDETYAPPRYRGTTLRDDLAPEGQTWFTSYAMVGTASLSVAQTPGGLGIYGSEACGPETTGVIGGWDCDPAHWEEVRPPLSPAPLVGEAYRLRDVDCYDGRLVDGVPIEASPASISTDGPCPTF